MCNIFLFQINAAHLKYQFIEESQITKYEAAQLFQH